MLRCTSRNLWQRLLIRETCNGSFLEILRRGNNVCRGLRSRPESRDFSTQIRLRNMRPRKSFRMHCRRRDFVVLLSLVLFCGALLAKASAPGSASSGDSETAAAPSGSSESKVRPAEDNLVCSDGDSGPCYAKYVKANAEEFVQLLPGQIVDTSEGGPIHVRMNFETGMREVKLLTEDAGSGAEIAVAPTQEMREFGASAPPESERGEKVEWHGGANGSYKNDETRPKLSLEEKIAFEGFYDAILNWKSGELLSLLEDLEDTVHHVDFGLHLASDTPSLERLVKLFEHEDPAIRGQAAVVLGSTFSNNPAAQSKAIEGSSYELVRSMMVIMQKEKDRAVLKRMLFAVSVLIRGNAKGTVQFVEAGGLELLSSALSIQAEPLFDALERRIYQLFADLGESGVVELAGEHADRICGRWNEVYVGNADVEPELSENVAVICSAGAFAKDEL